MTWLLGNYYEYINKEAIAKDRVVKVAELQAVLRGRKVAMGQRHLRTSPLVSGFNMDCPACPLFSLVGAL